MANTLQRNDTHASQGPANGKAIDNHGLQASPSHKITSSRQSELQYPNLSNRLSLEYILNPLPEIEPIDADRELERSLIAELRASVKRLLAEIRMDKKGVASVGLSTERRRERKETVERMRIEILKTFARREEETTADSQVRQNYYM